MQHIIISERTESQSVVVSARKHRSQIFDLPSPQASLRFLLGLKISLISILNERRNSEKASSYVRPKFVTSLARRIAC